MLPCLHQGNIYTKMIETLGMERPEMYSASRCKTGKLRKLGGTYRHGTVLAPRQYLYQKEATGMERPEMYSTSPSNNPTYLSRPSKYPVSREEV